MLIGLGHGAPMSSVSLISSFHFNGVLSNEHMGGTLKPWLLSLVVGDKGKGRSRNSRVVPVSSEKAFI